MKTYKLDPARLPLKKRDIIVEYAVLSVLMAALMVFLNWRRGAVASSYWLIPLLLLLFVFSGQRAFHQLETLWEGFSLVLDDASLTLTRPGDPTLRVPREAVHAVEETKYGLRLSTPRRKNLLLIPRELSEADFAEAKAVLEAWAAEASLPKGGQPQTEPPSAGQAEAEAKPDPSDADSSRS